MTENQKFKKGDQVKLKSGGPAMTVEGFKWNPVDNKYDNTKISCSWFDGTSLNRDYFDFNALELILV